MKHLGGPCPPLNCPRNSEVPKLFILSLWGLPGAEPGGLEGMTVCISQDQWEHEMQPATGKKILEAVDESL